MIQPHSGPRLLTRLAELPAKTLLDEQALAQALAVTTRTVRRMVQRGELPPPVRFAGRSTWFNEAVLDHVRQLAVRAAREAERERERIRRLRATQEQDRPRA
jgi:predicted DNA-binding transcriptional regulator AlpA